MEFHYQTYNKTYTEGGIPHLRLSLSLPQLEGANTKRCNRFYEEQQQTLIKLAEERLLPRLIRRYEESEDPRKRFRNRPHILTLTCLCREIDGRLFCERCLLLSHRGRKLYRRSLTECITPGGLLLPYRERPPRKEKSAKKKKARE